MSLNVAAGFYDRFMGQFSELLPFDDDTFDASLAQLVVHFMGDPVGGLREMARVTVAGGVVAACVWDHAGGSGPLSTIWRAVKEVDPGAHDESHLAGSREGHLTELFSSAGLTEIEPRQLLPPAPFDVHASAWCVRARVPA